MASRIPLFLDFEGGEIVPFETGDTINPTYATNVGGSGSENVGYAEANFGATPSTEATVIIGDQTTILATSKCYAWVQGSTTANNNEGDHLFAGVSFKCVCGIPEEGNGFTIYVTSTIGLCTGLFNIFYKWV